MSEARLDPSSVGDRWLSARTLRTWVPWKAGSHHTTQVGWDWSPLGFTLFSTLSSASLHPGLTPPSPSPPPSTLPHTPLHHPPLQTLWSTGGCKKKVAFRFGNETQRNPPNGASSQNGPGGPGSKHHLPKTMPKIDPGCPASQEQLPAFSLEHPSPQCGPLCSVPTLQTGHGTASHDLPKVETPSTQ